MKHKLGIAAATVAGCVAAGGVYAASASASASAHKLDHDRTCAAATSNLPELTAARVAADKAYRVAWAEHRDESAAKPVLLAIADREQTTIDEQSLIVAWPECFSTTEVSNARGLIVSSLGALHFNNTRLRRAG